MQMYGPGTGVDSRARLGGQLVRGARERGVHPITVERRLQQGNGPGRS
jgi:hypothetical protein